jgi:diaminopimelate epimerase
MANLKFTKMVASGNDFVVTELAPACPAGRSYRVSELAGLARRICDRKYGVGADGLLVLEKSRIADMKMRIFNADGSEAQMCGNGARCVASYLSHNATMPRHHHDSLKIETKAGIIDTRLNKDNVKIKLTDPKNIKLNMPIKLNNRTLRVNFINTGVPHAIIFVEGLANMDVVNLGRLIRFHKAFVPAGTNVDFVEVLNNNSIRIRTYERGVEDETLACGTGAAASALVTSCGLSVCRTGRRVTSYGKINVHTKGKEILKVYFKKVNNNFKDVWLEGKARLVCSGVYYV